MKRIAITISVLLGTFTTVLPSYLYISRDSMLVIRCFAVDDGIRPRKRCLMNPFRDKVSEQKAEEILLSLKNGETKMLVPYLSHLSQDYREHILNREKEFQVRSWRIGGVLQTPEKLSLTYWTTRENYDHEEEVNFYFVRVNGGWQLGSFSAIY